MQSYDHADQRQPVQAAAGGAFFDLRVLGSSSRRPTISAGQRLSRPPSPASVPFNCRFSPRLSRHACTPVQRHAPPSTFGLPVVDAGTVGLRADHKDQPRLRVYSTGQLAKIAARNGDIEQAASLGVIAVDAGSKQVSRRSLQAIQEVDGQLKRHARQPHVRKFRERARLLLAG